MKFGYFDDKNREYVITNYKTPLPWINYFGQDGFFSLMSNTCGGYNFYKDAKLRRITPSFISPMELEFIIPFVLSMEGTWIVI